MTENTMAQTRREGDPAFPESKENENSSSSPEGKETEKDQTHSPDGGQNNQDDPNKDLPFHEHPRWKEREKAWEDRFNTQETRHQEDLRKIREEFGAARKENAQNTEIPPWFGGTQEQWDAYRKDRDTELKAAEDRAYERLKNEKSSEDKAVKEATDFMNAEIAAIESDKELNPSGEKIDANKLLKIVLDNDLIDSKGRWNYRAGFRILQGQTTVKTEQNNTGDRKKLAGASIADNKGESKPSNIKTSSDFRKPGARPW